jgi:hypothetical protein
VEAAVEISVRGNEAGNFKCLFERVGLASTGAIQRFIQVPNIATHQGKGQALRLAP